MALKILLRGGHDTTVRTKLDVGEMVKLLGPAANSDPGGFVFLHHDEDEPAGTANPLAVRRSDVVAVVRVR